MYVCQCGMVSRGPSKHESHQRCFKSNAWSLRLIVSKLRLEFGLSTEEYSFRHEDEIKFWTETPERFLQIETNHSNKHEPFIIANFARFVHNNKVFHELSDQKVNELQSDDLFV